MASGEIRQALAELEELAGRLTAEAVLEAARPPDSVLHDQFQWDDGIAAEQHRLAQARTLIRSVKVKMVVDHRILRVVSYVRDPEAEAHEQGYRSVRQLQTDPKAARDAVVAEIASAAAHLRRARDLGEALGLADEVDELIGRLVALRRRAESMAQAA